MNRAPDTRSPVWIAIEWLACLALAGVLIAAALPKISNPDKFALAVYQYNILPSLLVNPLAIYLPWVETSCAAALVALPSARRGALLIVAGMLVIFTMAIALVVMRGQSIPCGCFGGENSTPAGWWSLARNCGLLVLAALALRATR
ncbi:MAG: MauE/DoxX family redox-associated membrane protein [Spartobacteria bacterium]